MVSRNTIKGSDAVRRRIASDLAAAASRPEIDHVLAQHADIISDLLPEDRAAVLSEYARLSATLPDVPTISYRKEVAFWQLIDQSWPVWAVTAGIAAIYFWQLFSAGAVGLPTINPEDAIRAPGRAAAVWAAFSIKQSLAPTWLVVAVWLGGCAFLLRRYGVKLLPIAAATFLPLFVPALFAISWVLTVESRTAAYAAGEQAMYVRIYSAAENADVRRWIERAAPKPIQYRE